MSYFTQYSTILITLQFLTSYSSAVDTNSKIYEGEPVEYVLYDKYTRNWKYFPILNEKWTHDGKLKLIIHGFNTHRDSTRFGVLERQLMTMLGEIYSGGDVSLNIVIADWTPLATGGVTDYDQVSRRVGDAGWRIAEVLIRWSKEGKFINWDFVHIIGFSLGAHVAGIVGDQVQRQTGQMVGRISGLDPAGPNFDTLNGEVPFVTDGILDKSDGRFVDVYHCNMGVPHEGKLNIVHGRFGSAMKAGHVDFYPQGGTRQSYACSQLDDVKGCSHKECMKLYAIGVQYEYVRPACPCESYEVFLTSVCGCLDSDFTNAIYMGNRANYYSSLSKLRYFAFIGGGGRSQTLEAEVPYLNSDLFDVEPQEGQKNAN